MTNHTPRQLPSLRLQLTAFYRACPAGDYLTAEDAAEKYRVDLSHAYRVLKSMVSDHELEAITVNSTKRMCKVVAYRAVVREVTA